MRRMVTPAWYLATTHRWRTRLAMSMVMWMRTAMQTIWGSMVFPALVLAAASTLTLSV